MVNSSVIKKLTEIEGLQLTDLELQSLIGYDDMLLRIDLLVAIKKAILLGAPPAPDALSHFFTVPNKAAVFDGKSVKNYLLESPSTENLKRTYKYFMQHIR